MKKILTILMTISVSSSLYAAPGATDLRNSGQLQDALLCKSSPSFRKMADLVSDLGGHNPENRTGSYRGTYTIPFGFQILNQDVTEFNVTRYLNVHNQYIYQIMTPLPNLSPSEAADLLKIPQDMETKQYIQGRLGIHVANGKTVLICTR